MGIVNISVTAGYGDNVGVSLPLMGIVNPAPSIRGELADRSLITPHGDREPVGSAWSSARCAARSLPLMGIVNFRYCVVDML